MVFEIKEVCKSFSGREILHHISFTVTSGKAMGFLGRNGAGKSTTIRCLMDVFKQDSGEFLMDGKPFTPSDHHIGYLPEERGMYAKSKLMDQLVYFARLRGAGKSEAIASASSWIDYFELSSYKDKPLETLSKGNQQKIQIAQAFLNDPDILILDEPFSGLDPVNAGIFKQAISDFVRRGKLVIFSSHQMGYDEEICDDITLIHSGNILLSGDLTDIKRKRGENKLLLKVDGKQDEEIRRALSESFPSISVESAEKALVLDTHSKVSQREIMAFLAEQDWRILSFGLYEPSLNDIFISLAGGEA